MPKQGLQGRTRQRLVVGLIALQAWQPVLAGVVATTPGVTQSQAANGVPVVNIAAPGSSGISHNTYTRFDVDANGLILNNSGLPANTQLGGYIPGNANLAHGSARLILNEVSGTLPSQLNGYMEIAGQKAEMVIANPAGITCSGCGFINTNRATLTTGLPQFGSEGSLTGFTVENGLVRIEGVGLNATNMERLALYSRALELNAALYANELQVVTGANTINVATGMISPAITNTTTSVPGYAIDSSAVGGMYANTIRLVGTEAGVGMRLAGPVAALTGKLEILGNGDVRLARASAQGDISVSARDQLLLSTHVTAGSNAALQADDIVLESTALLAATATTLTADSISTAMGAQIASRGDLQVTGGTLNHAGLLTTASSLQMDISGQLNNSGSIEAESALNLNAGAWTNRGQLMLRDGAMNINVIQALDNRAGSIRHGGTEFTLHAAALDNSAGEIASNGASTITLSGPAQLRNIDGILQGNAALKINGHGLDNSNGQVLSDGLITLQMDNAALLNTSGVIEALGAINVEQAAGIDNSSGKVLANGDISLDLANSVLTNNGGLIETSSNLLITNADGLTNQNGVLRAGQNITLYLPIFDRDASGGQYSAIGQLAIHATNGMIFSGEEFSTSGALLLDAGLAGIQLDSRVVSGTEATVNAGTITLGDDGFLATQGALNVAANTLTNLGVIYGRDALTLHIKDAMNNGSEDVYRAAAIISEGDISITRADGSRLTILNNYAGQIESLLGNITLKAEVVNNFNGGWAVAPDVWIESKPVVYHDDFSPTGSMADIVASSASAYSDGDYYFELTWDDSIPGYPRDSAANSCTNGACYYFYRDKEAVTHSEVTSQGTKAWIIASSASGAGNGNIWIDAGTLNNNRSTISAAGLLDIKVDATGSINNIATTLFDVSDINRETRWKACGSSGACSRGQLSLNLDSEALGSRPDQLITATLEGGVDVNLHGTVVNGEQQKLGHTVTSGTGAYSSVPSSAPAEQAASELIALGELGILDPTSRPGFQLPGNGVFHLNGNPAHPYLIETDPAINTYPGFLGSGYLIDYLDWAPDSTQRRLGDSYYELMLIREALLASIGSRFVDASVTDERTQYEYLMQNAIAASESLQLSPGISLSRAQIDGLQQDIVWMEEREIAGQKVLVPVVYLAQGSSRLLSDGAVIRGGSIDIEGDTFANAGLVRAHNSITINAARDISNLGGTIAAVSDIKLHSGTDILNESGSISGNDVLLQAEGDIINRTWTQREEAGSDSNGSWRTMVGDTASITATGKLTQDAGGDIRLEAAELAGENIELIAGNNILLDTLQIDEGYRLDSGNWQQAEAYVRHLQTQVIAARDLSLSAGADITAIAATLKAGSTATLEAGRNITLLAAEETDHYEEHSRSDGSFGRSKSHDLVHDESRMLGTTITVGNADDPEAAPGDLTMTAGNDITLYASQAVATGQADVMAGGNLNLIAGTNTVSHSEQSSKENAATYRNNDQGYIEQTAAASAISAGGDLNLSAAKDIRLTASVLHSGQTLRIGGDAIDPQALTATGDNRPMNVIVDTLALTNESWNETEKGFKGPLKELVKGLSFVVMMMMPVAALAADDMPEVTISEHDRVRSRETLEAGSSIYAQDLDLRTRGTAAFVGADINVTGTAAIRAENIILDAAAETSHYSHAHGSDTVKALGVNLDKDKGELRVAGVQTTKTSVSDVQDITQWRGTSLSAGNLILEAEKNIEILGSQLTVVNDALIQAGENLTIAGKEGKASSEHRETTETITVGLAVRNAYVDAVLAVKGLAAATDALKDAKDALADAEAKAKRGELDESDLPYFHANLAAATMNVVQAEIAAAGAVGAMATTGTSGGFYASASAAREKTESSTRSDQDIWQGSNIVVGGNAALIAGDTLTVKGSDVTVDKQAVAGADTSEANSNLLVVNAREINLVAGAERSNQSSKTRTDSQGGSVSFTGGGVTGGSVNAGYQEGDSEASSLHYINSHLRAGSLSSNSDTLRLRGAVVEADHIDIATQTLSVVSLQDEAYSKSTNQGLSVGMGFGNTAQKGAPADYAATSKSGSINYQKSESERKWVEEQSGIIGHDSIRIRATDTTLVGGLIANAIRDENGALIDQGNLDMETETLTVRHLYDIDRSKTLGGSFGLSMSPVPASLANGTESNAPQQPQEKDKTPAPVPHNTMTVGATYLGHDKAQTTHATLGLGHIVVGGKTLTDDNANSHGLGELNRDLNLAQEITKDESIGGLNFVTTVDLRLFSDTGLDDLLQEQKNALNGLTLAGMELLTVGKVSADVITNEVSLADMGGVMAGSLNQLHSTSKYVMGNAEGAAQIEAHANGESGDLVATQAATNSLTQSVNEESTRLIFSGTVAGAHDSVTGTNYINIVLTDSYVSMVGHEMAHSFTGSESIAGYMGWATDVIWSTGVWANSAAITAYKPTAINLVSLTEQNRKLLQLNNTHMEMARFDHAESFDYWGSIGHQYTLAVAVYGGGLSIEKSKMLGEAGWAPDTDSRNAMSFSSLVSSRDKNASQQSIHLLDGSKDYVNSKIEAYKTIESVVKAIKDMTDDEARNYLSNQDVQNMIHTAGDAFAHVNDEPLKHYDPTFGHVADSLYGTDPDSPNENPRAYAEMFEAFYMASSKATGKSILTIQEIRGLSSVISSTVMPVNALSAGIDIDKQATTRAQISIMNKVLGVKSWEPKPEYGILGYEHYKEKIGESMKTWSENFKQNALTIYESMK